MAKKRMFTLSVVDSDAFLDMPLSAQALYFHLNMRADDDGFIGNPKRIKNLIGSSEDDLKLLIAKRFVITFEDGVIVIKHWRMHNTIQKDRYTPTVYQDEIKLLNVKANKSYSLGDGNKMIPKCFQNVSTDIDIGLDIDKDNTIGDFDKHNSQDSSTVDDFFYSIWKLYPKKLGKGSVGKTKKKVLQRIGFEHMQRCIKRYVDEFNASGQDMKFMQYGSTFFNTGYVDYLDENWKERHEPVEKKVNQPTNTVQSSSNRFDCLSEALKNKLISQDAICLEDESVNFANLDKEDMQTLKELKVI